MISHNLNDVFQVADRIAVLYLGRLVAVGPAAEFDRQSRGGPDDHGRDRPSEATGTAPPSHAGTSGAEV